jgi:FMN-binding domain
MPKRGAFALGLTALGLALLLNFQVPTDTVTVGRGSNPVSAGGAGGIPNGGASNGGASNGGTSNGGTSQNGGTGGSNGGPGVPAATPAGGGSNGATGQHTVDGPVVDTRWGPVQVEVTLDGSKLVDIAALELPSGGRSGQISRFVEPLLRGQALQVQSANIDGVSGATYTSLGYARSLQAALDSAGS